MFDHLPEALSDDTKASVDAVSMDDACWFAAQLESDVVKWKRLSSEWRLRLGMQGMHTTTTTATRPLSSWGDFPGFVPGSGVNEGIGGGGGGARQLVQVQVLAVIARTLENHSKN